MGKVAQLLVLLVVLQVSAQEAAKKAAVLDHPKKVYVDNQRKRLYWPLGKPFWVRLAESPDSAAKSYLLENEIDSAKTEADVKLDGTTPTDKGIRLDMSGKQALRWYNLVTGEKHNLRFYSDGDAPECELKLLSASAYTANNIDYFGKGLSFDFKADDRGAGLEHVYVSVNNGPYSMLKDPISLTAQMTYNIQYYAVDNVGNASIPAQKTFVVDLTAPVTKAISEKSFAGAGNKTILSRLQAVSLVANDSLSGVKETFYKFDAESNFQSYKGALSLRSFKDGDHSLTFYSVDNVGNEEGKMNLSFSIDNAAPVPNAMFNGDVFEPKKGQFVISPRTQISATAKDILSDIGTVEYAVNGAPYAVYKEPFQVSALSGKYIVNIRATDKLGNISPATTLTLTIDAKYPFSTHKFVGSVYKTNYTTIITPETKIELNGQDDNCGIKNIQYSFENDKSVTYTQAFSIPTEGSYILKYHATDNVNNQEDVQMVAVAVDNTPPTITEAFSTPKLAGSSATAQFQKSTMIFLQATDNLSGLNGIWYSIDGAKEVKYDKPVRLDKTGDHKIMIRAIDNVGKYSEKTIAFSIKE